MQLDSLIVMVLSDVKNVLNRLLHIIYVLYDLRPSTYEWFATKPHSWIVFLLLHFHVTCIQNSKMTSLCMAQRLELVE